MPYTAFSQFVFLHCWWECGFSLPSLFWLAQAGMWQPSNVLVCPSKLTMKSSIILQHKYYIPGLDANSRRRCWNTNRLYKLTVNVICSRGGACVVWLHVCIETIEICLHRQSLSHVTKSLLVTVGCVFKLYKVSQHRMSHSLVSLA